MSHLSKDLIIYGEVKVKVKVSDVIFFHPQQTLVNLSVQKLDVTQVWRPGTKTIGNNHNLFVYT